MAANEGSQLAALCALGSFLWLSSSVQHHPLLERPRLSSALVLLISGIVSYLASFASLLLPGANGRFDNNLPTAKEKGSQTNLPKRPRRYFLPAVVAAVVIRLELFRAVNYDVQCSTPGVECFLPLALIIYEILPGRRPRSERRKEEDDTLSQTTFEDFDDWAETSGPLSLLGGLLLSYGAYRASTGGNYSTYFCSALDRITVVFWSQLGGLLLDAVIIILLWRILAWAKTTKSRLRTLSGILLASALTVGAMVLLLQQFETHDGIGFLYVSDIVFDGFIFSLLIISSTFVVCEGTPSTLAGTVVMICGLLSAKRRIALAGTWENVQRGQMHLALLVLFVGFAIFSYASGLRSVLFARRILVLILLALFFVCSAIYILGKGGTLLDDHPLDKIIYSSRIEADRWLTRASVSKSVKVAVDEYHKRNQGRDPPPKFDIWYKYATDRNSAILDHFEQIALDFRPFWGLSPEKIREGVALAIQQPGVAFVGVKDGVASHSYFVDSPYRPVLDDLLDRMKTFSQYLPDMQIPINMGERPRVLVPWDDLQRYAKAGQVHGHRKLLSRRGVESSLATALRNRVPDIAGTDHTLGQAFRQMTALACPPGTAGRSGVHWNIRDFCTECARPQAEGPFIKNWDVSLDVCHQPDLARLHGFHITPPLHKPVQQLIPIFSRAKTNSYSDILIPLRRRYEIPEDEPGSKFQMKRDQLFWRGYVDGAGATHELLHGGHQERLTHLLNNSTSSTRAIVALPSPNMREQHKDREEKKDRYRYELAHVSELTSALHIDAAIGSYLNCKGESPPAACIEAQREFGPTRPEDPPALKNRYVLLTDSDDGPPAGLLQALRSTSVPFVASVFREWYSERLMPWVHFVPVDIRYQGVFGTLAYFTGLRGRGDVNGRDPKMEARQDDAVWIAEQGRTWAGRAVRREDQEVYLFRVLLEYARLVDDRRDEIGFVLSSE